MNTLYFGDNLDILRDKISSDCVDLIYLDPPFQSGKNYNIIFQPELNKIKAATAQIKTFQDTWRWGDEAENEFQGLITGTITKEKPNQKLIDLIKAMRGYLGECPMMAYFSMMAPRLVEMRRVMKETGSIYLHCDPTASHYLKLLMDAVFGTNNFQNEIVWCYEIGARSKRRWGRKHDIILFYSKSERFTFNLKEVVVPRKPGTHMKIGINEEGRKYQEKIDRKSGKAYRYYLDEGAIPTDWWVGIQQLNREEAERLGYPTQKPEKLLQKIIKANSNESHLRCPSFLEKGRR
jgi:site-specific DNA-methyltransferase (adenine-specific)